MLEFKFQKEFEEMMCKIQESCAKSSTPPAAVSTTTPLLAQFSFDNVWYRAEVKGVYRVLTFLSF